MAIEQPDSKRDIRPGTALAWLAALFLFHVAVNSIYLSRENLPPSYDCANHLGITLRLYETWRHPGPDIFSRLLEVSPYYPPLPHFVASLFFGVAGVGADSAHASLMIWMLILIVSVYESGRLLFDRLTGRSLRSWSLSSRSSLA
jgi:4-amino-4-deoxy-L-arabinose transferase-like glycosyltransferase